MKEKKTVPALFEILTTSETLELRSSKKNIWIEYENKKLKAGDVVKMIDHAKKSNYLKFEVLYIGVARVNMQLIQK